MKCLPSKWEGIGCCVVFKAHTCDDMPLFEKIPLLRTWFLWLLGKVFRVPDWTTLHSFSPSHRRARPFSTRWAGLGCATSNHTEIYKWLIFMRASTSGVCQGIWKPQPLFSASLHQNVWVYLLTICRCFDISCWFTECLMTHPWSEVIFQWVKDWLLVLPWAILSHFLTDYMLHSSKIKKWQPRMSPISVSYAWSLWVRKESRTHMASSAATLLHDNVSTHLVRQK